MKINMTRKITGISCSANEWQLFGYYPSDPEQLYASEAHRELVADQLNTEATKIANYVDSLNLSNQEAARKFYSLMEKAAEDFSQFGATDTEGRYMISRMAKELYGLLP